MYTDYNQFLTDWNNPNHEFKMTTSGSTGEPKILSLRVNKMRFAVSLTAKAIPDITGQKILCCLPTNKMGGFMQLVRATLWKTNVKILEPAVNPMLEITSDHDFESISISPMQLAYIAIDDLSWKKLLRFKSILVGGGTVPKVWEKKIAKSQHKGFYATFGMTETYGHFALRNYPERWFSVIEGTNMTIADDGQISVCSPITDGQWMLTEDLVKRVGKGFLPIGRKNNTLNTGGLKFQSEEIEHIIRKKINQDFYVTGVAHPILGEEIVLVVEQSTGIEKDELNRAIALKLDKYASIKRIVEQKVEMDLITGKVLRKKVD